MCLPGVLEQPHLGQAQSRDETLPPDHSVGSAQQSRGGVRVSEELGSWRQALSNVWPQLPEPCEPCVGSQMLRLAPDLAPLTRWDSAEGALPGKAAA